MRHWRRRKTTGQGDSERDNFHPVEPIELPPLPGSPLVLSREEHTISRKSIDPDALKVMGRLIRHGYRAFLVGGGVRDLLLGKVPKDFDISTDARPENVRSLFRNSRIIGRRFRLNHVFFGPLKIFEVSTFRASGEDDEDDANGQARSDNTFGDPLTDALRRDLTINGLFYDLATFSVIDYVGGIADLRAGIVRVIGEPDTRFNEDPVRMIRAVRHAARTGFRIEDATYASIVKNSELISTAASARVFEELTRELHGGYARYSFALLDETGLLRSLLPSVAEAISRSADAKKHLLEVLGRIDQLIQDGREVPLAVIFLAITVGVIFETDLQEIAGMVDLGDFFAMIPGAHSFDNSQAGKEGSSSRLRTPAGTVLRLTEAVEALYRPLGVPRKDRERMVAALRIRNELFSCYFDSVKDLSLKNRKGYSDAVLLLEIIGGGEAADGCLRFFRSQPNDDIGEEDDPKAPKRRRRRRRTRRPRGRGVRNATPESAA